MNPSTKIKIKIGMHHKKRKKTRKKKEKMRRKESKEKNAVFKRPKCESSFH
jgi:hypothetical protein